MNTLTKQLELQQKLAKFDKDDLMAMSRNKLRMYCRDLNITKVPQDDQEVSYSKARKESLVEGLMLITQSQRIIEHSGIDLNVLTKDNKSIDSEEYTSFTNVLERAAKVYDSVKDKYYTSPEYKSQLQSVAIELNTYILAKYKGNDNYNTRCTKRSLLLSRFKKTLLSQFEGLPELKQVEVDLGVISGHLYNLGKQDSILKAENYKAKLDKRSSAEDVIDVHLDPYIDKARQVLTSLNSWRDVALALALVTGRRVFAEILMDTTEFTVTSDKSVMFKGQAKTRDRGELDEYEIPTLVSAELVVAGFNYLKDQGKLGDTSGNKDLTEVRRKTSTRHSRYINETIKSDWPIFEGIKPKALRELYALQAYQNYVANGGKQKLNVYICNILGHSDRSVADAYQSDYNLISGY